MSALCLGLCFDCYFAAILFYVFMSFKFKWYHTCLSVFLVHLFTFFVVLEMRQAVSATSIFIGSVPVLWV